MPTPPVPTHYSLLSISPTADPDIIRAAYLALARKYHPDNLTTGNEERFKAIKLAYDTLMDPAKRSAYDHELTIAATPKGSFDYAPRHEQFRQFRPTSPATPPANLVDETLGMFFFGIPKPNKTNNRRRQNVSSRNNLF